MRTKTPPLLTVFLLCLAPTSLSAGTWTIALRDTATIGPSTIDQHGATFTIAGLSGIAYLGGTSYLAAMDNANKLVALDLALDGQGKIETATVTGGTSLAHSRDFESIVYNGPARNSVWLAEENGPGVHEYHLVDGSLLQSLAVPPVFAQRRSNLGFESLTAGPDGSHLWTANEEGLSVDGPRATREEGSVVRLLRYDRDEDALHAAAQYAYRTEPIHGDLVPLVNRHQNGLVDLATLPDGTLLALERSMGVAEEQPLFVARIFAVDTTGATDVSGFTAGLGGENFQTVAKELLWSGGIGPDGNFENVPGANLEGLTLGPQLGPNRWALVGVVDDGDPLSQNALVVFEVALVPEPSTLGLAAIGTALLAAAAIQSNAGQKAR